MTEFLPLSAFDLFILFYLIAGIGTAIGLRRYIVAGPFDLMILIVVSLIGWPVLLAITGLLAAVAREPNQKK